VVELKQSNREVRITFRYCPPGKLRPGKPQEGPDGPQNGAKDGTKDGAKDGAKKDDLLGALQGQTIVAVEPFYVSETEVSVAQFAAVLPKQYQELCDRVRRENEKQAPDLVEKIAGQSADYPVFAVTLADVLAFCRALDEMESARAGARGAAIERRRFRIPTHFEWQYACRALSDPAAAGALPHFNRWPDSFEVLAKTEREQCLEEWREMGRQEADFRGTQQQVAEIIKARLRDDNPKPLVILNAFLKASLGIDRNFAKNVPGQLLKLKAEKPNPWNIYGMHASVRQWTITLADRGEAQSLWDRLASDSPSAEDKQRAALLLAGGSFLDIMTGSNAAWMKFTIWGGFPFDLKAEDVAPFSLQQLAANPYKYAEQMPGVRIVMERVLADNWLLLVRRQLALPADLKADALTPVAAYRKTIEEIVPPSRQQEALARVDYYHALALYRLGRIKEAADTLDAARPHLFAADIKPDVPSLEDIMDGAKPPPKPSDKKPQENPDQAYFAALQQLVAKDAEAAK
jgi:formylglycine-generating enzyme required for sulfatase activity